MGNYLSIKIHLPEKTISEKQNENLTIIESIDRFFFSILIKRTLSNKMKRKENVIWCWYDDLQYKKNLLYQMHLIWL